MRVAVKKECLPKETPEKKISSEIQGLSASEIEKILKMVHLLKAEFFGEKKKASIESFRKAKGAWGDIDIKGIYKKLDEAWKQWTPVKDTSKVCVDTDIVV